MAKKFVRGVTDVKNIENFDTSLTNINDIVSDGQHTYIHTKKGDSESYYKLTDNINAISSSNTDLISVATSNNKTTLNPKHDAQKEQVLESERATITINHGTNATTEKTKVDTNPEKVLEHNNLLTDYGISKTTTGNTTKLGLEYTKVNNGFDLNSIVNGNVRGYNSTNAPTSNNWYFVSTFTEGNTAIQTATGIDEQNTTYVRRKSSNVWGAWREQVGDKSVIDGLLAQKQNKLTSNASIGVLSNNGLRQLYLSKNEYTADSCFLKTHVKLVAVNTNIDVAEEEYSFILKIKQGSQNATFNLNGHDKTKFNNIITAYGVDSSVRINGCLFTLNDSTLTVSTDANTGSNFVITFSDII